MFICKKCGKKYVREDFFLQHKEKCYSELEFPIVIFSEGRQATVESIEEYERAISFMNQEEVSMIKKSKIDLVASEVKTKYGFYWCPRCGFKNKKWNFMIDHIQKYHNK